MSFGQAGAGRGFFADRMITPAFVSCKGGQAAWTGKNEWSVLRFIQRVNRQGAKSKEVAVFEDILPMIRHPVRENPPARTGLTLREKVDFFAGKMNTPEMVDPPWAIRKNKLIRSPGRKNSPMLIRPSGMRWPFP
jgi:hypothetical protein